MKYHVNVMMNIYPMEEEGKISYDSGRSLYHQEQFEISGERFSDVAPTIDSLYAAIHDVVEQNGGQHG